MLANCCASGGLCKANGGVVWLCDVNTSFVRHEVNSPSKGVGELVHLISIHSGIEMLNMTPTISSLFLVVWCMPKAHTNNIALNEELLDGLHNVGLIFFLRKIVNDQRGTYAKFGGITFFLVKGILTLSFS